MNSQSARDEIIETVNKLFVYTDQQEWKKLQDEVFTKSVLFDMSSLGMEVENTTAKAICETWQKGFVGLDAVNHLAGNYIINVKREQADVFAYATATHYKKTAKKGTTREFVGTYDLHIVQTKNGWRIDSFKYTLKYATGNADLV